MSGSRNHCDSSSGGSSLHHSADHFRIVHKKIRICRELTKKHETVFATTISAAVEYYKEQEPKGECVLVIEGKSRQEQIEEERQKWEEMSIQEHMDYYMDQGIQKKEAMKMVAKDRGVGKRDIYQALL